MSKKTKPDKIDPRLQRVFDELDAAWSEPYSDRWTGLARALLMTAFHDLTGNEPVKQALAAWLVIEPDANEANETLDQLAKLADADHEAHCSCCRNRKSTLEAA